MLFAICLELVLQFAISKFKVSEMSSRHLMCLLFFYYFYIDDGEHAFTRGGHCATEKCDSSEGNIC